ncbi:MAG: HD domain-containing protein [Oscillospiraceae bacterium]|nr:HD domain-containing protein [Oscillospiraceae bacterium]
MDELIIAITTALDMVECNLLGCSVNHGKRISSLCASMGRNLGMDDDTLSALTTCALFHDNALTEYILSERPGDEQEMNMLLHCRYGQRNIGSLPLKADSSGFILYHHERADGKGPFNKIEGEFPLGAELIAIADMVDVDHHLQMVPIDSLPAIRKQIAEQAGTRFTRRAAAAMLDVLDEEMILSLREDRIEETVARSIPVWVVSIEDTISLSVLAARIINYKSMYTMDHSTKIANIVWTMSGHYNFDHEMRAQLYLAASLHDIGKLSTPTDILEKPGLLDENEFDQIKEHSICTHDMLKNIVGFENICNWASCHHERLDGSGYPFKKNGGELDFISRLLACADIYEAVSAERPYHSSRNHRDTMKIMYDMVNKNLIDGGIVKDFDAVMGRN